MLAAAAGSYADMKTVKGRTEVHGHYHDDRVLNPDETMYLIISTDHSLRHSSDYFATPI